jgi:uncharacterized protein (DUF1499 family)
MIDYRQRIHSRLARWSCRIALFSAALTLLGIVLHRLSAFPTPVAINLFLVATILMVVAILGGLLSLIGIWRKGYAGASAAFVGIVLPLVMLAWPLTFLPSLFNLPHIADVTTDWTSAPRFEALAPQRAAGAKPAVYPGEALAQLQQSAYPDLRGIQIERSAEETFELVEEAVRKLRWRVAASEAPAVRAGRPGVIEATDQTLVLGFPDDIAIRVVGNNARSRIDIRSASRYGTFDFGQNATRIRRFYGEMQAQLDATLPNTVAGRRRLRTTRGAAMMKRLKERDQPKAAPRTPRDRAPSSAQRERAPKETQR